jgi:hypothetical protein
MQGNNLLKMPQMSNGTAPLKNVNNYLNTNIYSSLETSGGQSSNLYVIVVNFFNTSVNLTSVATLDTCFPALVSNTCCSILISVNVRYSCQN